VLGGLVSYIDRATLSIGSPLIRDDLHLSVADMGVLLSAFLWAYAFAQLPVGALVDRLGPRRLLAIGIVVWSSAQAVAGIFNCSSALGTAIAGPLLTTLMLSLGWRWMFVLMAVAGMIIAALWYALYHEPASISLSTAEQACRRHVIPRPPQRPSRLPIGAAC
jgi:sugar phosphate permease